jgi:hypothetical protein
LGLLFWRFWDRPALEVSRARIESRSVTEEEVDRHLGRYGARPEERWAASAAYFRLQRVAKGISTVTDDPATWGSPGAARRLGETALQGLGWRSPGFEEPTDFGPLSAAALADGGHEGAREWLRQFAERQAFGAVIPYFFSAYLRGARPAREAVVAGLRAREDHRLDIAAAVASLRPSEYPERQGDIDLLARELGGSIRQDSHRLWGAMALALGRSEDPRAAAGLAEHAERLAASEAPADRADRALLLAGRVAGGNWESEPEILPFLVDERPDPLVAGVYAEAVAHRLARGDSRAVDRVRRLWTEPVRLRVPDLRIKLATAIFLRDTIPAPDAGLDDLLEDLVSADSPPADQVIGQAALVRRGRPGAVAETLRLLASFATPELRGPSGMPEPQQAAHPPMVGFRALYLHGDSSGH